MARTLEHPKIWCRRARARAPTCGAQSGPARPQASASGRGALLPLLLEIIVPETIAHSRRPRTRTRKLVKLPSGLLELSLIIIAKGQRDYSRPSSAKDRLILGM